MICANAHTWTPSGLIAMKLQVMNVSYLAEKRGGGWRGRGRVVETQRSMVTA